MKFSDRSNHVALQHTIHNIDHGTSWQVALTVVYSGGHRRGLSLLVTPNTKPAAGWRRGFCRQPKLAHVHLASVLNNMVADPPSQIVV